MMDITALLQTITGGLLVGAGALLLEVRRACDVHATKIDDHAERIERIEDNPRCPHV